MINERATMPNLALILKIGFVGKSLLVFFLLILAVNIPGCTQAPLFGGFGSPAMVLLEDYYYDRVSLEEAEKYVKAQVEQADSAPAAEVSCSIPVFVWPDNTIVRVEPSAAKLDVRPGDRILMLDGEQNDNWQGLLPLVGNHHPDEELNLVLVRNGAKLDRKVRCLNGQAIRDAWLAALGAASEAQWHECAVLSDELDRPPLNRFSGIVLLHYYCSEANRILSNHIPTETDAALLYGARMRQLQEAKYVPGGMEKIKPEVLNSVDWLERNRFRPFAAALAEELEKRISP